MVTIKELVQSPTLDSPVELFSLDARNLGGDIYYFVSGITEGATAIKWQGNLYAPVPVQAEGFDLTGEGALPRPKLRVANISGIFSAAAIEFKDLIGATVTRTRTFRQFLDDGESASPIQHFPLDVYKINRKVAQNRMMVEWELSPALDQEGLFLPRRQVLQGACTHIYRRWNPNTNSFDYSKATCPYSGGACFDAQNNATTPPNDKCSKRLTGCELRFGNNPLPTRQFPGVARV